MPHNGLGWLRTAVSPQSGMNYHPSPKRGVAAVLGALGRWRGLNRTLGLGRKS